MSRSVAVEIAVQDVEGARAALEAGATRVELCQGLALGGLTPSLALVERTLDAVDPAAVHVLVRPRAGGFVYTDDERDLITDDIRACAAPGVGGVVVGALTADGRVDVGALERWRDAASGTALVFHRAIDAVADPVALLADLRRCGVDRILTSGGAERSIDGLTVLERIVAHAAGIEVMVGGGVRPEDIAALLATGADAVHLSARAAAAAGAAGPVGGGHDVTDPAVVAAAVAAVIGGGFDVAPTPATLRS